MSQAIVRQALEIALDTWAQAQSIPVAWENRPFTAPEGVYVRAFLLPAQTLSQTLDRVHRRFSGVFQVSLVMPAGAQTGASEALIASLSAAFAPQTPLVRSGVTVYLIEPMSASPALQEPDRYVIPCSVPYEAHTY